MNQRSGFNFWRFAPGILVSIFAVILLSKYINFQDFLNSFIYFNVLDILLFFIFMIFSLIARGFVWKSFLDKISLKDAFLVINEGYLFNNLIPRSGEVARIIITDNISENTAFQGAIAIFFERAIDLIIAAGLFLTTISFAIELNWLKNTAIIIFLIFTLLVISVIVISFFSDRISMYIQDRKSKIIIWEGKLKPFVLKALHTLGKTSRPKKILQGFFWIISSWTLWIWLLYYAILQVEPQAPLWWAIFCEGLLSLGIALPSAPANLGVYEGTLVFALSILGIGRDVALSLAIIIHIIQILTVSVIGLIALFIHDFKVGQIISKIIDKFQRKK